MKKIAMISVAVLLICCTALFTACGVFGGNEENINKEYTITYYLSEDAGAEPQILTVKKGDSYKISNIPSKLGYTFKGWYDQETNGTQYVSAKGNSIANFSDSQNIVLYPQFQAKTYNVFLDFGEADATGTRKFTASFGGELADTDFPTNPSIEHKIFKGWFTEEECNGVQITDKNGLIPARALVNENNFAITESTENITLYAGFEWEKHEVTFYYDDGSNNWADNETVDVSYGTNIKDVVPEKRNEQGFAPYKWSLYSSDNTYFTGKIIETISLYCKEWAPCIDFNTAGGNELISIVATAGTAIDLPTPTKKNYKFLHWIDDNGDIAIVTSMPSQSITLTAVWQSQILFDANGGNDVEAISKTSGTAITLPTPTREGYVFAGWYNSDKELTSLTQMPSTSIELKAGWYRKVSKNIVVLDGNEEYHESPRGEYIDMTHNVNFDFSEFLADDFSSLINVEAHFKAKFNSSNADNILTLKIYTEPTASNAYLIYTKKYTLKRINGSFYDCELNFETQLVGNKLYLGINVDHYWITICDFYYTIYYADTSYLYL